MRLQGGASAAIVFLCLWLPKGQAVAVSSAPLVCVSKCRPEEQSAPRLEMPPTSALSCGTLCLAGAWLSVFSQKWGERAVDFKPSGRGDH